MRLFRQSNGTLKGLDKDVRYVNIELPICIEKYISLYDVFFMYVCMGWE